MKAVSLMRYLVLLVQFAMAVTVWIEASEEIGLLLYLLALLWMSVAVSDMICGKSVSTSVISLFGVSLSTAGMILAVNVFIQAGFFISFAALHKNRMVAVILFLIIPLMLPCVLWYFEARFGLLCEWILFPAMFLLAGTYFLMIRRMQS